MTKEYLKMADVFHGGERQSDRAGIGGVIDTYGEFILQANENNYCSNMLQGDRNEYRDTIAKYAANAINSHDELVAEVERLHEFERDATRYCFLRDNCTTQQADSHGPIFVMTIRQKDNPFNVGLSIDEAMNERKTDE